jgi:hypothetical protein
VWEGLKRDMRQDVDPQSAELLDSISYQDLTSGNGIDLFRRLAGECVGARVLVQSSHDVQERESSFVFQLWPSPAKARIGIVGSVPAMGLRPWMT